MTNVRDLLRNERAARRIKHPHASYSTTGKLECTVCHVPVISQQEDWNKHLKTPQHAMRFERLRVSEGRLRATATPSDQSQAAAVDAGASQRSKRRRLSDEDTTIRKKTKSTVRFEEPDDTLSNHEKENLNQNEVLLEKPSEVKEATPTPDHGITPPVDEDEWAAFERDMASIKDEKPHGESILTALTASATITSAPIPAGHDEDLEGTSGHTGRERREAEAEEEKEDAARALEEEFDEMEALEARVRRLREKREEVRKSAVTQVRSSHKGTSESGNAAENSSTPQPPPVPDEVNSGSDEDDSEDEDDWIYRRRN